MKKSDREKVFNKFDGKCAYCGEELQKGWHVDHLIPIIRKRKYVKDKWVDDGCENPELDCFENWMPSCASCNINKHSGSLEEFRNLITGFLKHLNEVSTQYKIAKRYGLVSETKIKEVKFYFEKIKCYNENNKQ